MSIVIILHVVKKKKVFLLLHSMDVGGVENALLGILSVLPLDSLEVHVGLLHHQGGFLKLLPRNVKIVNVNVYNKYFHLINGSPWVNLCEFIKQGKIIDAAVHLGLYIQRRINGDHYWFYRYFMRNEPMLSEDVYDVAVSFAGPSQMMDYYVCQHVNAKVKCIWIHFDVSQFGIDRRMAKRLYKKFTRIFVVSETAKDIFDKMFPKLAHQTEVFHNIVSFDTIHALSQNGETFSDEFEGKRILTVGRVSEEKGQKEALIVLKMLLEKGYNVKWYFIGGGRGLQDCLTAVNDYRLEEHVCFLGVKTNPYGYMKDCDVYVQPSRHEGFCITLAEALCFDNPIVATCFTGAKEQLMNRTNGKIVEMEPENICDGVVEALRMEKVQSSAQYTNDIDKFLKLFL